MTVRFVNYRFALYISIFLLSGTVLGLAANFANMLPPNGSQPQPSSNSTTNLPINLSIHNDFTIFSIIVPSLTILVFLLMIQWSQPRIEVFFFFILGVLWITMGAWSTDIMGNTQCDVLGGITVPTKKGEMSAQEWCYEMRVIQAFSWMSTAMFAISFMILIALVSQAQRFGRFLIWREPIQELGWFGEWPGYYNQTPGVTYPAGYTYGYPGYPMNPQQVVTTVSGMPTVAQVPI